MAGGNIQYGWFVYWDDNNRYWTVSMRKRGAQIGDFEPLTLPQYADHPRSGFVWPYQRLCMRHISVKLQDGKVLQFPCQRVTSANYNNVGGLIDVPLWDTGIDDGGAPSVTVPAVIVGRTAERVRSGGFLQLPDDTPA